MIQRAAAAGEALLRDFGLHLLIIANSAVGGATNGRHMLGFGCDLGSQVIPTVETGLLRTLRHFLDGGIEGRLHLSARICFHCWTSQLERFCSTTGLCSRKVCSLAMLRRR